jgi:predicted  nucleic acid-binding Zn-ribbon protein
VLPLRSPAAVADSLRRRHLKTIPYDAWPSPRGELVWLRYVVSAHWHTQQKSRGIVLFDDFLKDWKRESQRLAEAFGFKWPRLSPSVESEIASFLDAQQEGPAVKPLAAQPLGDGTTNRTTADMTNAELAEALYAVLPDTAKGDGVDCVNAFARVEELIGEHEARMKRTGDILVALEATYPLIWKYYELHRAETEAIADAVRRHERTNKSMHRMWDQLSKTAGSNVSLSQELGEAGRHADQLVLALERAEGDKRGLRASLEEVGGALKDAGTEIDNLRREKEDVLRSMEHIAQNAKREKEDLLRSVEEIGDALKRADQINRDLTTANEAYIKQSAALERELAAFPTFIARRFRRLVGRVRRKLTGR